MDIDKTSVLNLLRSGKNRAITGSRMATILGYHDDRQVRIAIRELISDGYPIASSVVHPYGYYIVSSQEERDAYVAVLRARALEDFRRLRDFRKASLSLYQEKQIALL